MFGPRKRKMRRFHYLRLFGAQCTLSHRLSGARCTAPLWNARFYRFLTFLFVRNARFYRFLIFLFVKLARPLTKNCTSEGHLPVLLCSQGPIVLRERAGGASKFFPRCTLHVSAKTTTTPKAKGETPKITLAKTNYS